MATWFAKTAGDWFAANAWNSLANGSGTDTTAPLTSTDTADLNGKAMTTTTGSTITQALVQATTGTLTPTGTLTITGNAIYNGTGTTTTSMILGGQLTINGKATVASTGSIFYSNNTNDFLKINNSGTTAYSITGNVTGGIRFNAGAAYYQIVGDISVSTTGFCSPILYLTATGTNNSFAGAISCTAPSTSWIDVFDIRSGTHAIAATTLSVNGSAYALQRSAGVWCSGGTVNLSVATAATLGGGMVCGAAGGTINWTGSTTVSASTDCYSAVFSGILALATTAAGLSVTNSGRVVFDKAGGALTVTAAGHNLAVANQSSAAAALALGQDISIYVTSPSSGGGAPIIPTLGIGGLVQAGA